MKGKQNQKRGAPTADIRVLNTGHGDTKLTFDPTNAADAIRAQRIITDMLKRGYALLVEVERDGRRAYQRVYSFQPETFEYIIADFDSAVAERSDRQETAHAEPVPTATPPARTGGAKPGPKPGSRRKAISAVGAKTVAVAHTAGG